MGRILFKETQNFKKFWFWLVLLPSTLIPVAIAGVQLYKSWQNQTKEFWLMLPMLVIFLSIMVALSWLMLKMKLIVEIEEDGINYKFPPVITKWKKIPKVEIANYELREYKPISEFGGWGVKGGKYKKAYSVSGNIGLEIKLKSGGKVLFGTQKKQAVESAMKKIMPLKIN